METPRIEGEAREMGNAGWKGEEAEAFVGLRGHALLLNRVLSAHCSHPVHSTFLTAYTSQG